MREHLPIVGAESGLADRIFSPAHVARGDLYVADAKGRVKCTACAHRCVIASGAVGACGVRQNRAAQLWVPHGYVARRYVRAVETNTIFHLLPGAKALTFGMYGCDLRCPYCHNHRLSQALRDGPSAEVPVTISAEALVEEAERAGCRVVCAAYNEPLISAEWVRAVFLVARRRGLRTALVSDGHSTPEALSYLRGVTDVFRVDLKAHSEDAYRQLGGRLQPVLDSISLAIQLGYWVEVVTLVVPGFNQERRAIKQLGGQLRAISPDLPWHLNGFVPRYRLAGREPADAGFLLTLAGSAYADGSRFVYVGNSPACRELAHTRCPGCRAVVVRRAYYATSEVTLTRGQCPECSLALPGIWD